jgi:hypothetical protein
MAKIKQKFYVPFMGNIYNLFITLIDLILFDMLILTSFLNYLFLMLILPNFNLIIRKKIIISHLIVCLNLRIFLLS